MVSQVSILRPSPLDKHAVSAASLSKENSLWEKIKRVIKRIINFLCFWKSSPFKGGYTAAEKQIMTGPSLLLDKKRIKKGTPGVGPKQLGPKHIDIIASPAAGLAHPVEGIAAPASKKLPPKQYDKPHLQDVVTIATDVTGNIADVVFEHDVKPLLDQFKGNGKDANSLIQGLGKKVMEYYQVVQKKCEGLVQEQNLDEPLQFELQQLVSWLLINDTTHSGVKKEEALAAVAGKKKADNLNGKSEAETNNIEAIAVDAAINKADAIIAVRKKAGETLAQDHLPFIDETLNWLIATDHKIPLSHHLQAAFPTNGPSPKISKEILDAALSGLLDHKISLFAAHVNTLLDQGMETIAHKFVKTDVVQYATRIHAEKLADILEELNWKDFIDTTAGSIKDHTDAYLAALKSAAAAKVQYLNDPGRKALLAKAQDMVDTKPKNAQEAAMQAEAKEFLQKVKEGYFDKECLAEQKRAFKEGFKNAQANGQALCHPVVASEIQSHLLDLDPKAGLKKGDRDLYASKAEKDYLEARADAILDLLDFPKTPEDLDAWKDQLLELPKEVTEAVQHLKELSKAVISPSWFTIASQLCSGISKTLNSEETKKVILFMARDKIKGLIVKKLTDKLNHYTDPDEFRALFVGSLMSETIVPQLIQTFAKTTVQGDPTAYADDFRALIGPDKQAAKEKLVKKLFENSKEYMTSFSYQEINFDVNKFAESIAPMLDEVEQKFNAEAAKGPINQKSSLQILKDYFADHKEKDNNPVYGKIVYNLVHELSQAPDTAKSLVSLFQGSLSEMLVSSLHDFRASPALAIKKAKQKLPQKLTKQKLSDLIYGKAPEAKAIQRQAFQNLKHELEELELKKVKTAEEQHKVAELQGKIKAHPIQTLREDVNSKLNLLARMVYDIAINKADLAGQGIAGSFGAWLGKKAVNFVASPKELHIVFADLFEKLIGNQTVSKNLVFHVMDRSLNALNEAKKAVVKKQISAMPVQAEQAVA